MESRRLISRLGRLYPPRLAESYDHPGRQVGRLKKETKRVLVALDFDEEVLAIARSFRPDLIVTHHPFIFGTPGAVFRRDPTKRELAGRVESELGCPIYSYHTNFDAAPGGMNDIFAVRLGLVGVFVPDFEPAMRVGDLPEPMEFTAFARWLMGKSGAGYAGLVQSGSPAVRRVALVAGGGAGMFRSAIAAGADVYVSGDCPHHVRREIVAAHFNYVDLPHEIERMFVPHLKKVLLALDPSLEVLEVDHEEEARYLLA